MTGRRAVHLGVALLAVGVSVVAGIPGWAGSLGQRGPSLEGTTIVVDDSGTEVGLLLGERSGFAEVLLQSGQRRAFLLVGRDEFLSNLPAWFETTTCEGPPFIQDPLPVFVAGPAEPASIGSLGEILVADGDPETRTIRSELRTIAGVGCVTLTEEPRQVRPAAVLPAGPFVPPFRVTARPGPAP